MSGSSGATKEAVKSQRCLNYDFLRICAAVMVVILHVSGSKWDVTPVDTGAWAMMNVCDSAVRSSVPLFLMLTGVFTLRKDIDIKVLYVKKVFPLCLIWLAWSFFYAVDVVGISEMMTTGFADVAALTVRGHFHLWFIPTLAGIYALLPLLKCVVSYRNGQYLRYFLVIFFVFGIMRTTLSSLIDDQMVVELINKVPVDLVQCAGYVLLGYYLANMHEGSPRRLVLIALYAVSLAACAAVGQVDALASGAPAGTLYGNFSITTFVEAVCIFLLFRDMDVPCPEKKSRVTFFLSKLTFGIYLIHPFVISQLEAKHALSVLSYNPILSIPVNSMIIVFISACLTALMSRVPVLRRLWVF